MMCESKMISKNNDEVDVGCGNAFGGEGAEEAGTSHWHPHDCDWPWHNIEINY